MKVAIKSTVLATLLGALLPRIGAVTGKMHIVWAITLIATILLMGCGSAEDESIEDSLEAVTSTTESRVLDRVVILSSDDLIAVGLKAGKKYDVETLPGGLEARLHFWRVDDVAVTYETRFYESHTDAVSLGTEFAEEGSGENAALDAEDAVYKEGVRDRRTVFDFRGTPRPRYGAYAIYGNMVVLCEGRDDAEGWDRCAALIEALDSR